MTIAVFTVGYNFVKFFELTAVQVTDKETFNGKTTNKVMQKKCRLNNEIPKTPIGTSDKSRI